MTAVKFKEYSLWCVYIQSTIDEMYYSDAPDVQAEFSSYFGKKRPTPEEYVYTMATKIKY